MTKPTAIAVIAVVFVAPTQGGGSFCDFRLSISEGAEAGFTLEGAPTPTLPLEGGGSLGAPMGQGGGGVGLRGGVHYNPHYQFTVAAGLDIFRTQFGQFVSVMATPRGPMLYSGQSVSGFTTGAVLTRRGLTWGLGWGISF